MAARSVQIGTQQVPIPPLSAPIGPETLRSRYPKINVPADVALVDRYLAAVANLQHISPSAATAGQVPQHKILAVVQAVRNWKTDRNGAIAAFQRTEALSGDEVRDKVILPNGKTWETLTTYGELSLRLEAERDRAKSPHDYIYTGGFKEDVFVAEVTHRFNVDSLVSQRFTPLCVPGMRELLGRLSRDARIIDIRWIAYMLATSFWESANLLHIPRPPKPPRKVWRSMQPSREMELGAGRNYYLPVKVAKLSDGRAEIVEQDGQRFVVSTKGDIVDKQPAKAKVGAPPNTVPHSEYEKATGAAFSYYGRGHVQLTWWNNYAKNGAAIGMGLELLFNPDRALDPTIAYKVMSDGMLYGVGFANGHRLQHYFSGGATNYVGARAIVNGRDPEPAIVRAAELFEAALMASKA